MPLKRQSVFNVKNTLGIEKCNAIINIKRVNDLGYINKFFECINQSLKKGGRFFFLAETALQRKKRVLKKYPIVVNWFVYCLDFIFHRIFPKLKLTNKLYYFVKGNRNRVLHEIEILGRLYSCGFELIKKRKSHGMTYMVVEKVSEPTYTMEPSYGPLIKLNRVGKGGKRVNVYKLRSMYAYSEFIQEYIYQNYSLADGGKMKRDPRVSKAGKILRKYWIDELPMLINFFKGELKIFGVRPLSPHYLSLYPDNVIERRLKSKPGLIPPVYVEIPKTFDDVVAIEMRYLEQYEKAPLWTDTKYFCKAIVNIFLKGTRSK